MDFLSECLSEAAALIGIYGAQIPACRYEEDFSKYLQREKRLLSLAKEHQRVFTERKIVMCLPLKKAENGVSITELSEIIGKKLMRETIDKVVVGKMGTPDISAMTKFIEPELLANFDFKCASPDDAKLFKRKQRFNENDEARILQIIPKGNVGYEENSRLCWCVNFDKATSKSLLYRAWRWRYRGAHYVYFHDTAMFFGWLTVLSELFRYVNGLDSEERNEDIIYSYLAEVEKRMVEKFLADKVCRNGKEEMVISAPEKLSEYLSQYGTVEIDEGAIVNKLGYLPLYCILHHDFDGVQNMRLAGEAYAVAFCKLRLLEEAKKQQDIHERELAAEYAKVYMTKKNIPEKTIRAMSASRLNKHFGYVEFDEDVDLKLVSEFEKDFEALQTILCQPKLKDYQIRLRKLGRHHAAGLYFPTLRCMCVDLRILSSTAHEYFHLMDSHYGNLSLKASFAPVSERYTELLRQQEKTIKKLCGGSKYNLNYYLMPTEIFARCAEMYLVRTLKVENSLVKPDSKTDFAYPDDEMLMEKINCYFDTFIKNYCQKG